MLLYRLHVIQHEIGIPFHKFPLTQIQRTFLVIIHVVKRRRKRVFKNFCFSIGQSYRYLSFKIKTLRDIPVQTQIIRQILYFTLIKTFQHFRLVQRIFRATHTPMPKSCLLDIISIRILQLIIRQLLRVIIEISIRRIF